MKEIWKDIKGYEGKYLISNTGKVKSLTHNRLLKPVIQNGYMYIHLCKNSKDKIYLLHRLVAKTFIPNPGNLPEVNHKDENKVNNDADNLEWCTSKYNSNYGTRNKRKSKPIQCIETGEIFWGAREMERQIGIKHGNIARAIKNGTLAGGYHWKYAERKGE